MNVVDRKLFKYFYIWKNKSDFISHNKLSKKTEKILENKKSHYTRLFCNLIKNVFTKNLYSKRIFFERRLFKAKLLNFRREYGLHYNRIKYLVKDDNLKETLLTVRTPFKKIYKVFSIMIKLLYKKKGPLINCYNKIIHFDEFKFKSAWTKWKVLTIIDNKYKSQSMDINKCYVVKQIFYNLANKHKIKLFVRLNQIGIKDKNITEQKNKKYIVALIKVIIINITF